MVEHNPAFEAVSESVSMEGRRPSIVAGSESLHSSLCACRGFVAVCPTGKRKSENPRVNGAAFSEAELEGLAKI